MKTTWHGRLFALLASAWVLPALGGASPGPSAPSPIHSRRFEIDYQVNEESLPLSRVELWFSLDQGGTWLNFGRDADCQSPVTFEASDEGLYGFYLVLANEVGASTAAPQRGTEPQQWAFVDYTPPILQVRSLLQAGEVQDSAVRVAWSAVDDHFSARPIELAYRMAPDGAWQTLGGPVANTGMFDWHPPSGLSGRVAIRVTATDEGGNRAVAVTEAAELIGPQAPAPVSPTSAATPPTGPPVRPPPATEEAIERSDSLLRRGMVHKERGEYRLAVSRFRDALSVHPALTEALVQLGETLYFQRQYAESVRAYQLAVEQAPTWTPARRGLARSMTEEGRYEEAAAELARLVEADPKNAQAWLDQGDVAIRRGDEARARTCWREAESLAPREGRVIERARVRLSDLERLAPGLPAAGSR